MWLDYDMSGPSRHVTVRRGVRWPNVGRSTQNIASLPLEASLWSASSLHLHQKNKHHCMRLWPKQRGIGEWQHVPCSKSCSVVPVDAFLRMNSWICCGREPMRYVPATPSIRLPQSCVACSVRMTIRVCLSPSIEVM